MQILYVGEADNVRELLGNEIEGQKIDLFITGTRDIDTGESYSDINRVINKIIRFTNDIRLDFIMYEAGFFINDSQETAEIITNIFHTTGVQVIIFAPGWPVQSAFLSKILEKGFKNFILGSTPDSCSDQFQKCLNGYYSANEMDILVNARKTADHIRDTRKDIRIRTVSAAGTEHHIGCTTLAVQLVKRLTLKGYKPCLVIYKSGCMNEVRKMFQDTYRGVEEINGNGIRYEGVDIFSVDSVSEIRKLEYDFLVYDFGSMDDLHFPGAAFRDKEDYKVIIGGVKEDEVSYTERILSEPFYKDAIFVLNFVPQKNRQEVIKKMKPVTENVFFMPLQPDKFSLSEEMSSFLDDLVPVDDLLGDKKKTRGHKSLLEKLHGKKL